MSYFEQLTITLCMLDPAPIAAFIRACAGTLWIAGNGGSMATAQHWACDLSRGGGLRAQSLGSNGAVLTAWANDVSFDDIFSGELRRLQQPGDALICLSCSGTSPNITRVLAYARTQSLPTALLTSNLCHEEDAADLIVRVPHTSYGIIEDCHSAIGHWVMAALSL